MMLFAGKKDILELLESFDKSSLSELEISTGAEFHIKLSKNSAPENRHIPKAAETFEDYGDEPYESPDESKIIKAPLVGTFYASPSPDSEPYVAVGDMVEKGMVLCIIEAMKTMNEIESDARGEVIEILAKNGHPVEYGQPLFRLK
ncbi:MAG: acetyl-CoA carboxylase biotin carboxyl carrier protein [Oscillospiraceae bacterium]|nr:acetyl-CoA carboxylase biotin carboxyl carrier protein [Oscillospiraceae bacterium]